MHKTYLMACQGNVRHQKSRGNSHRAFNQMATRFGASPRSSQWQRAGFRGFDRRYWHFKGDADGTTLDGRKRRSKVCLPHVSRWRGNSQRLVLNDRGVKHVRRPTERGRGVQDQEDLDLALRDTIAVPMNVIFVVRRIFLHLPTAFDRLLPVLVRDC